MSRKNNKAPLHASFLEDTFYSAPQYVQQAILNSWAHYYVTEIFPLIDESIFDPLFCAMGRPSVPANIMFSACILMKLNHLTPEEFVLNVHTSTLYQYALGVTSYDHPAFSIRTFYRFQARLAEHYLMTGEDLFKKAVLDLARKLQGKMGFPDKFVRMDSMLLESNIARLSRPELLYVVVRDVVCQLNEQGLTRQLTEKGLIHYTEPNDFNVVNYHRKKGGKDPLPQILKDIDEVLKLYDGKDQTGEAFRMFDRVIKEQTIVEAGIRRLRNRVGGGD